MSFVRGEGRARFMVLLAIAAVVPYLNSLGNGFALDDVYIVELNRRVHTLGDQRSIWLTPYWPFMGQELGLWRPLVIFGYAVQWAVGGGSPWLFHAVAIVLHAVVTVLVFLLLARLVPAAAAFAGALVFAVHPVHTEAVANVVGQAELLAAALMLAACLIHASRPDGVAVSLRRALVLAVLFGAALLVKEHAIVLPGLLVMTDLAQRRVRPARTHVATYVRALIGPGALLIVPLVAYLVVRYHVLGGSLTGGDPGPQLHFLHGDLRVLNALRAFPEILRLLFLPIDLSADYSPAVVLPVDSVTFMVGVGTLLLAALVGMSLLTPWAPRVGYPAAWFLISIITVSNLLFPVGVLIAERTLYLPSVALSAAVAFVWVGVSRQPGVGSRLAAAALLVVTVGFGIRTWVRNPDWLSTNTVLYSVLRDRPESYRAQWTHGSWQYQQGNVDAARYHYALAHRIYPHDSQFLADYGRFLLAIGETAQGVELLEQAYAMHPFVEHTVVSLASAYVAAGNHDAALRIAAEADRLGVPASTTLPIRGAALDGRGDADGARLVWRMMLRDTASAYGARTWLVLATRMASAGFADDAFDAVRRARRESTDGAAVTATADAVEAAIRAGCYNEARASDRRNTSGAGRGETPACAALLRAVADAEGTPQNASVLHNATLPQRPEADPASW